MTQRSADVDAYIGSFPEPVQTTLTQVRQAVHRAAPGAAETISYKIPTMTLDGTALVYFAGWKNHVSLYPVPAGDEDFQAAVAPYRAGPGTLRFPLARPVPYDLIERLVVQLVRQHSDRAG
jgi:uncharacterized protein YdhG (YjbR/CyaY superfamily)